MKYGTDITLMTEARRQDLTTRYPTETQVRARFALLADVVEARGPELFDMDSWVGDSSVTPRTWCGTHGCIAGTAAYLMVDLDLIDRNVTMAELADMALPRAIEWLGLTDSRSYSKYFYSDQWPENIRDWIVYEDGYSSDDTDAESLVHARDYDVNRWKVAVAILRLRSMGGQPEDLSVDMLTGVQP